MSFIILWSGLRWRMPFSTRMVDIFHVIARSHGLHAVWIPSLGKVVTDDPDEPSRNLQYEEFIEMAAQRALNKRDRY